MYNKIFTLSIILFSIVVKAQTTREQFPVFSGCENLQSKKAEACFYDKVYDFVYHNFQVPEKYKNQNTTVIVLFEVDEKGKFKVQYVDAQEESLINESKRVFEKLPIVLPATYNGKPIYAKYTIRIQIPLQESFLQPTPATDVKSKDELQEYDAIVSKKFNDPQYQSHLSIPFSHSYYAQFDSTINQVGNNNHTASKPYNYAEVNKYYDFSQKKASLVKETKSWWGRKLWNENLVAIQGEDYWFTFNPIFDLQLGKTTDSKPKFTYINTRGLQIRGGLGKQLNYTTTIYESQGRFANYFNQYAQSIKPGGGNPAIIPGIGIAKEFKTDSYDFPLAEANITFSPNKFFDFQLGYGRNFIGDGYRSLIISDGASPYPYFKINTTFWKIKYTNTYMWLKDVRNAVTVDRTYATKYVANHYLSWNVTKRFNLGLFESVVWANQNNRGFDVNFVNPIIFYRSVEFASSARSGNALLGLTAKYKWNNQINCYGQFLIDEFSLGDVRSGKKSWRNKFGYQIGAKYYNAFAIQNLLLQVEYNQVRPYVYSHSDILTNYGHNNQSLGHQWGANFKEVIAIARYHYKRYFADAKLTFGQRGLDFASSGANSNYGGDLYRDYDLDRYTDEGVNVAQGNKTKVLIADLQAGYLVNPSSNMKVFASLIYRNFNPNAETIATVKENTTWFSVGLRCDIFNWYLDY